MMIASRFLCAVAVVAAAGCASRTPAPVVERGAPAPAPQPAPAKAAPAPVPAPAPAVSGDKLHTVKKGDTLYSIALEHNRDYKDIVAWNAIDDPNRIHVGQQLRVEPPEGGAPVAVARPVTSPAPVTAAKPAGANTDTFKSEPRGGKLAYSEQALARLREQPPEQLVEKPAEKPPAVVAGDDAVDWIWPAPGKTLANFADGGSVNKGIDIAGHAGEPVQAAGAGKVVYAGSGLRGYGNLVIVRHNASFLSAYAHNSKILVKEGQAVARGQKIAEIGSSDADQAKLHFEIRHQGKPVDPLKYLPAR